MGRVWLAGDPAAKVVARLVWGAGANESQTIAIAPLTSAYQKFPLKFTAPADSANARLEIVGTGSGTFHVGAASLMPADNMPGFHAGQIKAFRDAGFKMAKWPGGNFVSAYDFRDGLGDVDKRAPKAQLMWGGRAESNDVGLHEFVTFCRLLGAEPELTINVIRPVNHHFLACWREIDPVGAKNRGLLSLMRRHLHNLKAEQQFRLMAYLAERPALELIYRFKQRLCYLLLKKHKNKRQCHQLIPQFLRAVIELRQSGLMQLVALGDTLHSWSEEIVRMWRFTRSNGITEGFHNKMETISRQAYGFRNFENYRQRVQVLCS